MNPPAAPQHPYSHHLHNDVRPDPYYWLRDKTNPEVIAYLEAENQWFDEQLAPLSELKEHLYQDMLSHVPPVEDQLPVQNGPYFYGSKIPQNAEYPYYYRVTATHRSQIDGAPEEVLLDVNRLAQPGEFLSVTSVRMDPQHRYLAYLENRDGTDRYTLFIKDVRSHQLMDAPIPNVFIGDSVVWNHTGSAIFYLTVDEGQRPYRLWRHLLGDTSDLLLFEERDPAFSLSLTRSRDGQYLFCTASTKTTSEVRYLPFSDNQPKLNTFKPRTTGVLYELEHWHGQFLVLTNENAVNFTLLSVPSDHPDPAHMVPLFPYDPKRYLQAVLPFEKGLLVAGREDSLTQLWTYQGEVLTRLPWDDPLYTVTPGNNLSFSPEEVLVRYQSLVTPPRDYAISFENGERSLLREQPIVNYQKDSYQERRLWAHAEDGTPIPLSAVATRRTWDTSGPHPIILYGYGSYGMSSNPTFDPTRIPLSDRGVIYVIAHVRGGSEMGYQWYLDGKLEKKRNTFSDFIASAQYLVKEGYTTPELLGARGRSAGGLLMGAIINMRPDLFKVVVAGVPFVDVVTTMLDASIPLTTLEWDEWGNPEHENDYVYMKSYSPYDNVTKTAYPHLMVYTGLNDPRVGYFEPAKWVARLREKKTDANQLVLKTHMGAGHGGRSGRFAHLEDLAEEYAFMLDKIGIRQ